MKPFKFTLAVFLLMSTAAMSQTKTVIKKAPLVSYNITFSDYSTPGLISESSLSNALDQGDWLKPGKKSIGFGVGWWKNVSKGFAYSINLTGTFSNFPANFVKDDAIGNAKFSTQVDALMHFKAAKENAAINPFLTAGLGFGIFPEQFAIYAPLGTGLQFRFNEGAYLHLQMQWRKRLTDGITKDYLHYSIGFAQSTGRKKKEPELLEVKPVLPPDRDGDGVVDSLDECPDIVGVMKGCPDSDGDGIADNYDPCPKEYGTDHGCPLADTDNDGVPDKEDACPTVAGMSKYKGCPVPDTDKDGIDDDHDKCPDLAGIPANGGCPEIKEEIVNKVNLVARSIQFKFASDELLDVSLKPLNEVAEILKQEPKLHLVIEAHADNRGTPERNLMWSERRAKAVADYFIQKGISSERLSYKGYGDTKPKASNKTEAGRSKNRRVEMKLEY